MLRTLESGRSTSETCLPLWPRASCVSLHQSTYLRDGPYGCQFLWKEVLCEPSESGLCHPRDAAWGGPWGRSCDILDGVSAWSSSHLVLPRLALFLCHILVLQLNSGSRAPSWRALFSGANNPGLSVESELKQSLIDSTATGPVGTSQCLLLRLSSPTHSGAQEPRTVF